MTQSPNYGPSMLLSVATKRSVYVYMGIRINILGVLLTVSVDAAPAASNYALLLSPSYCGSGTWAQPNRVLCFRYSPRLQSVG